jgi:ABC-2 type transport system ATP-binding protein
MRGAAVDSCDAALRVHGIGNLCTADSMAEPLPTPVSSADALIALERVSKRFGRTRALDALDLHLRRGEVVGLLGPNGAGKTTLLHVLAGVTRADAGRVRLFGSGDPTQRATRRRIGLAPQALALYTRLSVIENLRFFGRVHGLRGDALNAGVTWGLQLADLEARAHERAGELSGGLQRRLNLACAVLHRPELLLLDEPTAGVDPQSRERLFEAIAALHRDGASVVYSTHILDEVDHVCDRLVIVDHGHAVAEGPIATLLHEYRCTDLQALTLALTGH